MPSPCEAAYPGRGAPTRASIAAIERKEEKMPADTIIIPGLGARRIRIARRAGPCAGWTHRRDHAVIKIGDRYWESEPDPYRAGGYAMQRCCMECVPNK